jgi:enamine deaminase RidA (YjgF/YER057c/UK114 family)
MAGDVGTFAERDGLYTIAGVRGLDVGADAAEPEVQLNRAFENLAAALDRAGISPDGVGRVVVVLPDAANRPFINPPWLTLFSGGDRPARRTINAPLPAGVAVELEATGIRGPKRVAVEVPGLAHADPLPMGAAVGDLLLSSAIGSQSPSGSQPEGVPAIRQAFENLIAFAESAGGTANDIANVSVFLGRWDLHEDMVDIWVETFPDNDSRPTRKTYYYPRVDIQLQCEAVLGGRTLRANFEIDGIGHHDPIPMAAVTGGLFTTSGVDGGGPW